MVVRCRSRRDDDRKISANERHNLSRKAPKHQRRSTYASGSLFSFSAAGLASSGVRYTSSPSLLPHGPNNLPVGPCIRDDAALIVLSEVETGHRQTLICFLCELAIIWIAQRCFRVVNLSSDCSRVATRLGRRVLHGRPCWHRPSQRMTHIATNYSQRAGPRRD
jgi:hypothetical protein